MMLLFYRRINLPVLLRPITSDGFEQVSLRITFSPKQCLYRGSMAPQTVCYSLAEQDSEQSTVTLYYRTYKPCVVNYSWSRCSAAGVGNLINLHHKMCFI